jgi:riboflavin biosynthesis pyrimidine reductase
MKIINVMAASLDGRIGIQKLEGDLERQNVGISGAQDQIFLRKQIESSDAIVVGAGSIRSNGECLHHPGLAGHPPAWFIFVENELPQNMPFWSQDDIPRFLISRSPIKMPVSTQVTNWIYGDEDPCDFLVARLRERGHDNVLLFGGGVINRWFYQKKLVDELRLTVAPVLIGKSDSPQLIAPELSEIVKFSLLTSHVEESFVFLTYQVNRS